MVEDDYDISLEVDSFMDMVMELRYAVCEYDRFELPLLIATVVHFNTTIQERKASLERIARILRDSCEDLIAVKRRQIEEVDFGRKEDPHFDRYAWIAAQNERLEMYERQLGRIQELSEMLQEIP